MRLALNDPTLVPAVARALALMDWLAAERAPVGLTRMAAELSLPKSSVHRLCSTLVNFDYLRRQPDGSYRIGPRVMGLANAFVAGTDVAREFATLWQDGVPPEDTVVLSVLSGAEVLYVGVRSGVRPLGLAFNVGMRLPAHLAATGKALLAWQDEATVRRLFATDPLPRLALGGPGTVAELLDDLARTRERGHGIDDEGVRKGVYGLAAPVFDASGQAVAGLGLCLHKAMLADLDLAACRALVQNAARLLTERIGGVAR